MPSECTGCPQLMGPNFVSALGIFAVTYHLDIHNDATTIGFSWPGAPAQQFIL